MPSYRRKTTFFLFIIFILVFTRPFFAMRSKIEVRNIKFEDPDCCDFSSIPDFSAWRDQKLPEHEEFVWTFAYGGNMGSKKLTQMEIEPHKSIPGVVRGYAVTLNARVRY